LRSEQCVRVRLGATNTLKEVKDFNLHSIVRSFDELDVAHTTVDGAVEAVVVLRGKLKKYRGRTRGTDQRRAKQSG
jgi:hypothetical protein